MKLFVIQWYVSRIYPIPESTFAMFQKYLEDEIGGKMVTMGQAYINMLHYVIQRR